MLISDLSISHGLLLCSDTKLHHPVSFPDLYGADVQTSAADRAEHLGTGQEYAQLTPLAGKEQEVTGSHREVSVSTYDLTDQFEKEPFNKMQASTRASTNCFLKNSSSYETLTLHIEMAKS